MLQNEIVQIAKSPVKRKKQFGLWELVQVHATSKAA